jgi:type II secretion system protein G
MRAIRPAMLMFVPVIAAGGLLVMEARHEHSDHFPANHVHDVSLALDMFLVDVGRYPTPQEGLAALVQNPGGLAKWHGPYLKTTGVPLDPWGQPYQYRIPGTNGNDFDLFTINGNVGASQ